MKRIGLTQRVINHSQYSERRDVLDQRWTNLVFALEMLPVPIPNKIQNVNIFINELQLDGIILTGGNDLVVCGGDAPERDVLEKNILNFAVKNLFPVIGVCRGMQMIYHYFNGILEKVTGHITPAQEITILEKKRVVNSYHSWGFFKVNSNFNVWAIANDGVIKAFSHKFYPLLGIMWHPERDENLNQQDITLLKHFLDQHFIQ